MAPHLYSPVARQDNENESEARSLHLQNLVLATFLGVVLCLSWNFFAVLAAWITGLVATNVFVLAIICLIVWVPVAYMSWYRLLSRALRSEDGKDYDWAFVFYIFYFSLWNFIVLSPAIYHEGKFITGIFPSMIILGENTLVGTLYLVGFLLFYAELILSTIVFIQVWLHYRHNMRALADNKDVEAMKDQSQTIVWFFILPLTVFCLCLTVFITVSFW